MFSSTYFHSFSMWDLFLFSWNWLRISQEFLDSMRLKWWFLCPICEILEFFGVFQKCSSDFRSFSAPFLQFFRLFHANHELNPLFCLQLTTIIYSSLSSASNKANHPLGKTSTTQFSFHPQRNWIKFLRSTLSSCLSKFFHWNVFISIYLYRVTPAPHPNQT